MSKQKLLRNRIANIAYTNELLAREIRSYDSEGLTEDSLNMQIIVEAYTSLMERRLDELLDSMSSFPRGLVIKRDVAP